MIKLFIGEDTFSIQNEIGKLTSAKDVEIFKVRDDTNTFINNLLSSSFFSTKRIFICSNYLEKLTEAEEKKIITALKKKPADTLVLFIEEKEPKGELKKFFEKNDAIKKFIKPSEKDILAFINKRVTEEGSIISPLAAERLASFVGADYWQLAEEIKKLSLYKKGEPNNEDIQTADVDLLVKSNFEANIFELIDAISTKNQRRAAKLISQFLDSGENEIYIFSMIAKQFRNIAMAKFDNTTSEKEFASQAGIHPYVAKKSIIQAKNFDKNELMAIYRKLISTDLKLKSGQNAKQALLDLVF
jgi:DNA polymerase III subunit delta